MNIEIAQYFRKNGRAPPQIIKTILSTNMSSATIHGNRFHHHIHFVDPENLCCTSVVNPNPKCACCLTEGGVLLWYVNKIEIKQNK